MTKEAFDILQINMETKKTKYEQEYKLLIKSKQASLESFIEYEKKDASMSLSTELVHLRIT